MGKHERVRGVKVQQASVSQMLFIYIVPMQNCITLQSRELHSPPSHTSRDILPAKKLLPNYLQIEKSYSLAAQYLVQEWTRIEVRVMLGERGTFLSLKKDLLMC